MTLIYKAYAYLGVWLLLSEAINSVKTQLYFDSPKMKNPLPLSQDEPENIYDRLFKRLYKNFPDIEFIPSTKGFFIEKIRSKLDSLSKNKTNEIIHGNIGEIISKIEEFDSKEEYEA